jgi:hypothetical protein
MEKFDYRKFLTENKLTKASILREGFEEPKIEENKIEEVKPKSSSKDELKAKIKEMIIAELSLEEEDGAAVTNSYYDPLDEGSDDEDYEKAGREVEYGVNPNDEKFDLKDFFMDDEEELAPEIPGFEGTRNALDNFKIREAKKDEEEAAAEEEAPAEEVDATLDMTDTGEDFNIDTSAVDPNIKAVQDALTQAQAAAKNISDEKLTQQIGNTITMFTRTHIANTEKQVNEEMPMGPEEYIVAVEDSNTNTTEVMFTGPKNKALTAYNNIGARYWDNPEARVFIMSKSAFDNSNSSINEGKSLTAGLTPEDKKTYDEVKNSITTNGLKKYSGKLLQALKAAAYHNEEMER